MKTKNTDDREASSQEKEIKGIKKVRKGRSQIVTVYRWYDPVFKSSKMIYQKTPRAKKQIQ